MLIILSKILRTEIFVFVYFVVLQYLLFTWPQKESRFYRIYKLCLYQNPL